MTTREQFDLLKQDYIHKSEIHLHELALLEMEDFNTVCHTVDVVLTQNAASLSFLSLSLFIMEQKRKFGK